MSALGPRTVFYPPVLTAAPLAETGRVRESNQSGDCLITDRMGVAKNTASTRLNLKGTPMVGFLRSDWLVDLLSEEIREVDEQGRKGDEG